LKVGLIAARATWAIASCGLDFSGFLLDGVRHDQETLQKHRVKAVPGYPSGYILFM
jgi:hypothetical protein